MKNQAAIGDGALERLRIAQIANYLLDLEPGDVAAGANQSPDCVTALEKDTRDVPSQKTRCARNQDRFPINRGAGRKPLRGLVKPRIRN